MGSASVSDAASQFRVVTMSEAGIWIAWGLPTQGRETRALDLLRESRDYLERLRVDGLIERFDIVVLRPQTTELGSQEQIDSMRHNRDFEVWVNRVQLVADRVGIVDAWVDEGIGEAIDLYDEALRKAGLFPS
jgi:hypothetical protein